MKRLLSLLLVWAAVIRGDFLKIEKYSVEDFSCTSPLLIFIYYDNESGEKCRACEGYKKWLGEAKDEKIGPFKIKRINFNDSPKMALRFKATQFPTFFLQYLKKFKNISSVDFHSLGVSYTGKKYENDIDAILKNPSTLDHLKTIEGLSSPSSVFSLFYAHLLSFLLLASAVLDRMTDVAPAYALAILFAALFVLLNLREKKAPEPPRAPEDPRSTENENVTPNGMGPELSKASSAFVSPH
ncbi:hypothetical protein NEDG_01166 [Nematocida displodere]|uniref:Thioredoxin domain-containing protein n=1 Tax=Nematocida displodere TaxID=1805483 RepID=A0A177EAR7_9MICR|nr:hypothetical protein NEDG_01166 [Nematocida displodere]